MYHVLAAEMLGAEGDLSGASAEYLEAAMVSEDPEIARTCCQGRGFCGRMADGRAGFGTGGQCLSLKAWMHTSWPLAVA